jgi:putative ABC transport system permease protein
MFRNYLLTALRNFTGRKLYTLINVGGLAVGLTCAMFIILFARYELSYDKWVPDSENLYRIELNFHRGGDPWYLATAPFPLLRTMQEQIPEVKATTHLVQEPMTVAVGDRRFAETVAFVDPGFFQVIKLPLVEGDPSRVLAQPESVVLSQSMARKYFADVDPIGKIITVTGSGWACDRTDAACLTAAHSVTITGLLRDLPSNTQLAVDFIIPNSSQADDVSPVYREQAWTSAESFEYVVLAPGADPEAVLGKLGPILDRTIPPTKLAEGMRASEQEQFHLTRFRDVHLTSDNYGGMTPPGSRTTVYGFLVIGALILLIACFNFTNLATARATMRAREISLRKVMGARRDQLIVQFLGESILMALAALVLALALVEPLLPVFDRFLNKPIAFHYLTDWPLLLAIVGIALVAGLLGGVYPAIVLSSFRPAAALRTNAAKQSGSGWLRTGLVVMQFAVSIALGIAAIVVFAQISFARHLDWGFDRDGIVVLRNITKLTQAASDSFANALRANSDIVGVALSDGVPLNLFNVSNTPVEIQGKSQSLTAHVISISPEFPSLYGMRLLAGRLLSTAHGEDVFSSYPFFSSPSAADQNTDHNVLINEEAARRFGYTAEDAVGKTMVGSGERVRIAGVLSDSLIDGARESISPAVYVDYPARRTLLSVRMHSDRVPQTLSYIDKTWRLYAPSSAIQRYFLTDDFDNQFKSDEEQGAVFGIFVGIAITIACLGLYGVAAFTAERRTREIGIRKVFGARTHEVVRLLLWQFSIPVLIANVIAWPVAYYYLHHWLESYTYRISLNPLYFVTASAVALGIASLTILAHAVRVARASPIVALGYE